MKMVSIFVKNLIMRQKAKVEEIKTMIGKVFPGLEEFSLAFVVKLVVREIQMTRRLPLSGEEYPEKQRVLLEILRAVGYNIPPSISNDKEEK